LISNPPTPTVLKEVNNKKKKKPKTFHFHKKL